MKNKSAFMWLGLGLALASVGAVAQQTTVVTTGSTAGTVPVFGAPSTSQTSANQTPVANSPISVSGSNVGIGTTAPNALLTLNSNSATTLPAPANGVLLNLGAADSQGTAIQLNAFGTNPVLRFRRSGGTNANPTTVTASSLLGNINFGGYDGTAWSVGQATIGGGSYNTWTTSDHSAYLAFNTTPAGSTNPSERMRIDNNGNVGIGTTTPGTSLEVNGNIKLTSGSGASVTYADGTQQSTAWTGVLCGGDYAEDIRASGGKDTYEPGDVLVLAPGDNSDIQKSVEPYSTMVAGIFATKPGVVGRRDAVAKSTNNIPMAMVGVVPTKVSTENGSIRKGDLLVTSSTPGYAMKGTDRGRMLGAVIGKAMAALDSGPGVIEVLVTLQ